MINETGIMSSYEVADIIRDEHSEAIDEGNVRAFEVFLTYKYGTMVQELSSIRGVSSMIDSSKKGIKQLREKSIGKIRIPGRRQQELIFFEESENIPRAKDRILEIIAELGGMNPWCIYLSLYDVD